jgi:hypothetical protein
MDSNEFVFWMKGIVDSTEFMPTKKTWDIITDKLQEVNFNKKGKIPLDDGVVQRINILHDQHNKPKPTKNPYEVTCNDTKIRRNDL